MLGVPTANATDYVGTTGRQFTNHTRLNLGFANTDSLYESGDSQFNIKRSLIGVGINHQQTSRFSWGLFGAYSMDSQAGFIKGETGKGYELGLKSSYDLYERGSVRFGLEGSFSSIWDSWSFRKAGQKIDVSMSMKEFEAGAFVSYRLTKYFFAGLAIDALLLDDGDVVTKIPDAESVKDSFKHDERISGRINLAVENGRYALRPEFGVFGEKYWMLVGSYFF